MSNTWQELEQYFSDDRYDYFCDGVNEEEITDAEKAIGLPFSPSYKNFLRKYGAATVKGDLINGLRYQADMDRYNWSVIDRTKFYKQTQKWPEIDDWYIISDDGRGNPIGCKPDGSVWLSDHDAGFEQVKLADSFEGFIHKLLTDTLYE
jgi:hypothetical protein